MNCLGKSFPLRFDIPWWSPVAVSTLLITFNPPRRAISSKAASLLLPPSSGYTKGKLISREGDFPEVRMVFDKNRSDSASTSVSSTGDCGVSDFIVLLSASAASLSLHISEARFSASILCWLERMCDVMLSTRIRWPWSHFVMILSHAIHWMLIPSRAKVSSGHWNCSK